jgi:hypothetical protein
MLGPVSGPLSDDDRLIRSVGEEPDEQDIWIGFTMIARGDRDDQIQTPDRDVWIPLRATRKIIRPPRQLTVGVQRARYAPIRGPCLGDQEAICDRQPFALETTRCVTTVSVAERAWSWKGVSEQDP